MPYSPLQLASAICSPLTCIFRAARDMGTTAEATSLAEVGPGVGHQVQSSPGQVGHPPTSGFQAPVFKDWEDFPTSIWRLFSM
jgi:hypothetical protein